jgi:hypothetical protein
MRLVGVLFAVLALTGCARCGDRREGRPVAVYMMPAADGSSLIMIDSLSGKGQGKRLIAVDVATGRETGLRTFGDVWSSYKCAPASPGRMWCELNRLALHDARTLATIAHAGDLIARSGVGRPAPDRDFIGADGDAVIVLEDGRKARIDPATLAVTLDPEAVTGDWPWASSDCGHWGRAQVGGATLSFGPGERSPLLVDGVATGLDFLQPSMLADGRHCPGCGGTPIALERGVAIVRHDSLLDRGRAHLLLTGVDGRGEKLWELDLGRVQCHTATIERGILVVTTYSEAPRAFGIDPSTGVMRWRYGI